MLLQDLEEQRQITLVSNVQLPLRCKLTYSEFLSHYQYSKHYAYWVDVLDTFGVYNNSFIEMNIW